MYAKVRTDMARMDREAIANRRRNYVNLLAAARAMDRALEDGNPTDIEHARIRLAAVLDTQPAVAPKEGT